MKQGFVTCKPCCGEGNTCRSDYMEWNWVLLHANRIVSKKMQAKYGYWCGRERHIVHLSFAGSWHVRLHYKARSFLCHGTVCVSPMVVANVRIQRKSFLSLLKPGVHVRMIRSLNWFRIPFCPLFPGNLIFHGVPEFLSPFYPDIPQSGWFHLLTARQLRWAVHRWNVQSFCRRKRISFISRIASAIVIHHHQ